MVWRQFALMGGSQFSELSTGKCHATEQRHNLTYDQRNVNPLFCTCSFCMEAFFCQEGEK